MSSISTEIKLMNKTSSHININEGFHAMAKPSGADCNLDCEYCFYLEKDALYPSETKRRMSEEVLASYVRNYIESHSEKAEVVFTWQGGEPTLMGLEFYRRASELQREYAAGRTIRNTFQTNGLLIDAQWCAFFLENKWLIGLSLDGPADIHDEYRVTQGGYPSHALVLRALKLLQQYRVSYNVLACVNRRSAREPRRVYDFLRSQGVEFLQFIPVVERLPSVEDREVGLTLKSPSGKVLLPALPEVDTAVTDWSVLSAEYGDFLNTIFDVWIQRDVGRMHVMNFEWALANFMGRPGAACHHQPTCGKAVVVEHTGDVYACDHYVYPDYLLGNLTKMPLGEMLALPAQQQFGSDKLESLPAQCRNCKMLKGCWGGCPKHRFSSTRDGEHGLNYLCAGYYSFFGHAAPYLRALAELIASGRPASDITKAKLLIVKQ